jgi:hypothetical protein
VGSIAYFWGINIVNFIIIHTIYEIFEITRYGTHIINTYFKNIWPGGGKHKAEPIINGIGDTIGGILGWFSAYYLDNIGDKYKWYHKHIK